MKKSFRIFASVLMIVVLLSVSVYAAGVIRDVKGKENPNITVTYNGENQVLKDGTGKVVYPVIINGSTYLPVRAIATTLGAEITWDGSTQTINITGGDNTDGSVPTDLPPSSSTGTTAPQPPATTTPTTPSTPSTGTSANAGTLEDPVDLGKSFTWADESLSTSFGFKSDVTMSVTSVKPITTAQIKELGFRIDEDPQIEYVRVTVNLVGRNVTPTTIKEDYMYMSLTTPDIWGTRTVSGKYVIGGTDYGFDGSISRNIDKRYPSGKNRITKGSTVKEINYSGDILLPIIKGETNYLVMSKANMELSTDERKIFFKLN